MMLVLSREKQNGGCGKARGMGEIADFRLRIADCKIEGFRCPAYALLSYGVAGRCQVSGKKNKKN
jgi:hypothetical protein